MRDSSRRPSVTLRWTFLFSVLAGGLATSGCGPSQEDLMMRAARRSRPTAKKSDDAEEKKASSETVSSSDSRVADVQPEPTPATVKDESDQEDTETADPEQSPETVDPSKIAITPIGERVPESPLTDQERRARSADNIKKIAEALIAYVDEHGRYPSSHDVNASGFDTLSWRVKILPYLGYQELHDKFDWTVPWDREPNKSLLAYIPDEFVSPERFDTKTNYLLPADRKFLFGENRSRRPKDIEDGVANTIMLLEVNDRLAQEWTKPVDYDPKNAGSSVKDDLGGLREDGTFAVWANGWPVLLANELSAEEIMDALSYEAGDGQKAGFIHRNITLGDPSEASVAATSDSVESEQSEDQTQPGGPQSTIEPVAIQPARETVPIAADLAKAKEILRAVYQQQINDASDDRDKSRLAEEMLQESQTMKSDPAGMYVLQSAAMRLASEAGDAATLIKAIDQRVGYFEVDAYEENIKRLTEFGQQVISRDPESVEGQDLLNRSVRVIYAGIADNDFLRASGIARIAFRYTGQERHERIPKLLTRLRVLLGTAKREYDGAVESLQEYRRDPSNAEAAAKFGMFLCFIKGDWDTGLPLLTKGGPATLQEVAALDLAGANNNQERVAIGDVWWELSELARKGSYRQAARDRAVSWYQQAYETMPDSLERIHVKSRMDEAEELDGTSPIALCTQLADELGLDLSFGLASVADVGQSQAARRGRGGRSDYD